MNPIRKSLQGKLIVLIVLPLVLVAVIGLASAVMVIRAQSRKEAKENLVGAISQFDDYVKAEEQMALELVRSTSGSRDMVFGVRSLVELESSDPVNLSKGLQVKLAKDLSNVFSGRGYDYVALYFRNSLISLVTSEDVFISDGSGGFEVPASQSAFVLYSPETWKKGVPTIACPMTAVARDVAATSIVYRDGALVVQARSPIVVKRYDPDTFASQQVVAAELVVCKVFSLPRSNSNHAEYDHEFQILDMSGRDHSKGESCLDDAELAALRSGPRFTEKTFEGTAHYACFGVFSHRDVDTAIVAVYQSQEPVMARTRFIVMWQLVGFSAVFVISLLIIFLVVAKIIKPITDMSSSIAAIDLNQPSKYTMPVPPRHRQDELGVLVTSINGFLGNLEENLTWRLQAEKELRNLNVDLERRIADRTDELKAANNALQDAMEETERATDAKSTFLANVSHELRTPLNAILGYAQLLQHSSSLTEEQQSQLQIINRSGEHLLGLINEVLEISKIEAGKVSLNESDVDLVGLLDDLQNMFTVRARDKGLDFVVNRGPALPSHLTMDESKLRQILINLLGNAVKHTQQGSVTFEVLAEPQGDLVEMTMSVRDTGIGISKEDHKKIFLPFYQAGGEFGMQEGTGLGLSISHGYAQLLGGDITVRSEVGKGSTFTLVFSAKVGEELPAKALRNFKDIVGLPPGQEPPRILLADDNEIGAKLVTLVLSKVGFEVKVAKDGQVAIDMFHEWKPDLILMDMRMPVLDGLEATRRIKSTPEGAATCIVAYSANVFEEEQKEMVDAGCDDVLGKPLVFNDLFDCIQRHLGLDYVYKNSADKSE